MKSFVLRRPGRQLAFALALAACTAPLRPAFALQPVTGFIERVRTWNPQNRAAYGVRPAIYLLPVVAAWKLDTTIGSRIRAQSAAAAAADQARQAAEDAVFRDWQQIHAAIESVRSSHAQVEAANLAASLAEDRYESGVATQLDVLHSRQIAISAEVARIQADTDLAYARVVLRLGASPFVNEEP